MRSLDLGQDTKDSRGKYQMGWKNLERDPLDYILTDLLPVELSDRFSFFYLYEFLLRRENRKELLSIVESIKSNKDTASETSFKHNWSTHPLKYKIMKGTGTYREMSLMQPFSALNIYLFIQCYQKEILRYFEKNHIFSIRYHRNNTELSYKSSSKKITKYFLKSSQELKKIVIQQAGNYFKIFPFTSINGFTDSQYWRLSNFKYKYFAKIDYKSCFDSIYSHVYSQIIEPHMIDSKKAHNSNLFIVIDRILQNINGRSSNGILVGPEFSRMVAEILLEHIDIQVYLYLEKKGLFHKNDYRIYRYVDDIFIFTKESSYLDTIIQAYTSNANQYRLSINELKLIKAETPCLVKDWLEKTRVLADSISHLFFQGKSKEYNSLPEEEKHILLKVSSLNRLKDEITSLMKNFPAERKTIVSFLLSALLNNISKRKEGYKLFNEKKAVKHATSLLDLTLFIYAFFPSFDQSEKVISIFTYIDQEIDFCEINKSDKGNKKNKITRLLDRYMFIFQQGNMHDICDWFPFFFDKKLTFTTQCEKSFIEKAEELNDPIILANLLLYCQYNDTLKDLWLNKIEEIIQKNLLHIGKDIVEFEQFWFVIVFFNCPFLHDSCRKLLLEIIEKLKTANSKTENLPNSRIHLLLYRFFLENINNSQSGFFDWSKIKKFGERIIYRTYKRTIFKRYKKRAYGLYVSIN